LTTFMMKNPSTNHSITMKNRFFSFFLIALVLLPSATADYSDRMKARLSEVVAAKDAGSVGEGVDGFLHLRQSTNQSSAKLVESENADRIQLFKDLARKTGGDVAAVARKFSQGIATKAKSGHWFKKSSGEWVQK
jgi:uncharacterized protein YdbL (DUF1318 family)